MLKTELFEMLLDFLIPPSENESIGGLAVWAWNTERHDLTARVIEALAEMTEDGGNEQSVENVALLLKSRYKELYFEITDNLLVDYFTHPDVKVFLGQNSFSPFPTGHTIKTTDWTILEPVFTKSQIHRNREENLK